MKIDPQRLARALEACGYPDLAALVADVGAYKELLQPAWGDLLRTNNMIWTQYERLRMKETKHAAPVARTR